MPVIKPQRGNIVHYLFCFDVQQKQLQLREKVWELVGGELSAF